MKRFLAKTFTSISIALCWIPLFFTAATLLAAAAPLKEARVSQVIQDVKLLEAHGAPRPAVVNDKVTLKRAVHTGVESRAELTFPDLTITRLGANTIFTLISGAREVDLTRGTILLEVPSGKAPVKASTGSITVAVTGGTALLGTGPPIKFMVLEGTGTMYPKGHPEKAVSLKGGEMVMATADGKISQPAQFDVKLVLETSHLIIDFPPLANLPLILTVMNQQLAEQSALTANPLPSKSLLDVIDVTDQNANANPIVLAAKTSTPTPTPTPTATPTPTPTPTPSKFGPPSVIASPVPYLITSGTVIKTDTSITTNSVTAFGKIYRGPTDDGAFTLWAFGSTSPFDTALKIDTEFFADPNNLPIAVFKFQSLSLISNPTIDLSNGGVTKLGLVAVDGITSGPPGGTLTFAGLDTLALATVNGPINLTSDISFDGLSVLAMYARGAGSDLTIDSPISNIGALKLAAENSIQLTNPGTMSVGGFDATAGNDLTLQIGGSLLLNGAVKLNTLILPGTTQPNGANLTLNLTGDYTNSSTGDLSTFQLTNQGTINQSANISLGVNGNLNCANGLQILVNNELDSGVSATHGGTIGGDSSISVSGSTVSTGGFLVDLLNENDQGGTGTAGGHIGGTASIAMNVNGALTANANNPNVGVEPGAFDLFIENYGFGDGSRAGFIGSNASVSIAAARISTAADFGVGIDNFAGGTIGGAAQLSVTAGSMSVDEFFAGITNGNFTGGPGSVGGQITGAASITFNITGALNVAGGTDNDMDEPSGMSFVIDNSGFGDGSPAGSIGSDASIDVTAGSISDDGRVFTLGIFNSGGGMIGGNASITVAANSISAAGPGPTGTGENLNLLIDNSGAGNINGSATISLNAGSVSTAGNLNVVVSNDDSGSIGGNATADLHTATDMTVTRLGMGIQDFNTGHITTAADVNLTVGGNLTVTSGGLLNLFLNSFNGGTIGTDANISASITGTVAAGQIGIGIQNQSGSNGSGVIGANALVTVSGGSVSTTGTAPGSFNVSIANTGGTIGNGINGGNAAVNFGLTGALTTASLASFGVNNDGGGSIGGNAIVDVHTATDMTVAGLAMGIQDFNTGHITTAADVNLTVGGSLTVASGGLLNLFLNSFSSGTIGTDANISASVTGNVTAGSIGVGIQNQGGGSIGGNAGVITDVMGDLTTTTGDTSFFISNPGDSIGSNAMINATANNISTGGAFNAAIDNSSGDIGGSANINFNLASDLTTVGNASFLIQNEGSATATGGTIGSDAMVNLSASNISTGGFLDVEIDNETGFGGIPGGTIGGNAVVTVSASSISTTGFFEAGIFNYLGHNIAGNATVNVDVSGDIKSQNSDVAFGINNFDNGVVGGTIGLNATTTVHANNISCGGNLDLFTENEGGHIGGDAAMSLTALGNITATGDADFGIINDRNGPGSPGTIVGAATINVSIGGNLMADNSGFESGFLVLNDSGGSIGGDATISVTAASITANYLPVEIDNSNGGTIGGNATITMNVSGTATVTNNATFEILGSDGAAGAAINFNGGSYDAGGTFLAEIDGDGTITFNNASAHANVLQVGALGTNGVLKIGGGMLSADTTLKLYAPGSNGQLNFVSNVTLGGTAAKILAANSVSIFNGVVVTIGGSTPADVYTGFTGEIPNANYTGFGGNGSTTGTFAGAGANNPQPLSSAPPFSDPPATPTGTSATSSSTTSTKVSSPTLSGSKTTSTKATSATINVSSTAELLSLLDGASVGPDGKATISGSKSTSNLKNLSGTNINGLSRAEHRMLIQRMHDRDTTRLGGKRLL